MNRRPLLLWCLCAGLATGWGLFCEKHPVFIVDNLWGLVFFDVSGPAPDAAWFFHQPFFRQPYFLVPYVATAVGPAFAGALMGVAALRRRISG